MALLRTAIGAGEMRQPQGAGSHRELAAASLVRVRVLVGGGKMEEMAMREIERRRRCQCVRAWNEAAGVFSEKSAPTDY